MAVVGIVLKNSRRLILFDVKRCERKGEDGFLSSAVGVVKRLDGDTVAMPQLLCEEDWCIRCSNAVYTHAVLMRKIRPVCHHHNVKLSLKNVYLCMGEVPSLRSIAAALLHSCLIVLLF